MGTAASPKVLFPILPCRFCTVCHLSTRLWEGAGRCPGPCLRSREFCQAAARDRTQAEAEAVLVVGHL